jgi:hypothetical protein
MAKKYLSSIRPNGIYEKPKLNNKMREEEEEEEVMKKKQQMIITYGRQNSFLKEFICT